MSQTTVLPRRSEAPMVACLLTVWAISGCGHSEPFGSGGFGSDRPFDFQPPVRLTLNLGPDRDAAWLPDGSGILYAATESGTPDTDVCLGLLPPSGGRTSYLHCDLTPNSSKLTDAFQSPAPSQDGGLAFVASTSSIGARTPSDQGIVLASMADPATRRVLRTVPYALSPNGRIHAGVSQLRWSGPNRLLYLAEQVTYRTPCQGCELDTLRSGLDATWLSVNEPGAVPVRVPGTDFASGVSPGSTEDELYYTLSGDTHVYRHNLSTGAVSVIYDFAGAGIVRDVHVVGERLVAVVGGRVAYGIDPTIGPTQWDSGGMLHVVDLQNGIDMTVEGPGLVRRPQLSPSGSRIVVEVYPLIIDPVTIDTFVSRAGDLYLFSQP
jgi:hypothetical protein